MFERYEFKKSLFRVERDLRDNPFYFILRTDRTCDEALEDVKSLEDLKRFLGRPKSKEAIDLVEEIWNFVVLDQDWQRFWAAN